jgi:hypothetical protein
MPKIKQEMDKLRRDAAEAHRQAAAAAAENQENKRVALKTKPLTKEIENELMVFVGDVRYGGREPMPDVFGKITSVFAAQDPRSHICYVEVAGLGGRSSGGFDHNGNQIVETNKIRLRIFVDLNPEETAIERFQVTSVLSNTSRPYFTGMYTSKTELFKKLIPPYFF